MYYAPSIDGAFVYPPSVPIAWRTFRPKVRHHPSSRRAPKLLHYAYRNPIGRVQLKKSLLEVFSIHCPCMAFSVINGFKLLHKQSLADASRWSREAVHFVIQDISHGYTQDLVAEGETMIALQKTRNLLVYA